MKIAFHTLGCKVNQYETEAMAETFSAKGYQIVDERDFADVYIINTCTVTAIADKKSRQYIRRMKKVNPDSTVVVTGCYAQIKPEEVSAVEGVDIVAGINEKSNLTEYVKEFMTDKTAHTERKRIFIKGYEELDVYDETGTVTSTENRTRAYIKIQEGCNRFCSYCVIPYARGKVRSRGIESILEEAKQLISSGYKELVLTGINTALYDMEEHCRKGSVQVQEPDGLHAKGGASEAELSRVELCPKCSAGNAPDNERQSVELRAATSEPYGVEKVIAAINELPGDFRIRLSSLEPAVVNADYVKRLLKYNKLCHHLHLSAQSGSDNILKAMNRPYDRDEYIEIVKTLRGFDPYYGISTDIIVGFPGEKERDFEDSCKLVEECAFCKTHIFKYSKRPFTKAAEMKEHVAPQVKNRRSDKLHQTGKQAAEAYFRLCSGNTAKVLLEEIREDKECVTGYTDNYTKVYIRYTDENEAVSYLNEFVEVRLLEPYDGGMTAEIIASDIDI